MKVNELTKLFGKAVDLYEKDPFAAQCVVVAVYRILKNETETNIDEGIVKYLGMHFMDMPEVAFADEVEFKAK